MGGRCVLRELIDVVNEMANSLVLMTAAFGKSNVQVE